MSRRAAAWLAWSMWAFSLALTASSLLLLALNRSDPNIHIFDYWVEDTVIAVYCSAVGAVIASRRPDHPVGWLFCAIGLVGGIDHLVAQYATHALLAVPGSLPGGEALAWVRSWLWVPHLGLFVFLGLLFPDGRLPSGRWRPFAWLNATVILMGAIWVAFSPGPIDGLGPIRNPLGVDALGVAGAKDIVGLVEALLFALALTAAISLFVRLRRARGVERQQLKWFAYAGAVTAGGGTLTYTISKATEAAWVSWYGYVLLVVGLASLPIAVGIAVLRYRLYDIDLLINRTLVYGALTATLAAFYFGGVTATQAIFRTLTGQEQQPQLAIVVSTLVIAALFSPLRRRIQAFIDRRFYRSKYDARKTLEAFSAKLRDETDLEALNAELVGVVRETMQPAHVSLWLRPDTAWKKDELPG